jgi:hypothetical protein
MPVARPHCIFTTHSIISHCFNKIHMPLTESPHALPGDTHSDTRSFDIFRPWRVTQTAIQPCSINARCLTHALVAQPLGRLRHVGALLLNLSGERGTRHQRLTDGCNRKTKE